MAASFLQAGMEGHASHLASSPLAPGRRPKQEAFCPVTQASTGALPGVWRAKRWAHLFATSHTASSATTPGGTRRVPLAFAHTGVVGIQLSANSLALVEWSLSKHFLSYRGPFPSPLAERLLLGFYKKICTHWHLSIKFYVEAKQSPRAHSQVFVGSRVPLSPFHSQLLVVHRCPVAVFSRMNRESTCAVPEVGAPALFSLPFETKAPESCVCLKL